MNKFLYAIPIVIAITGIIIFDSLYQEQEEIEPLKIAINVWPGYAHAFVAQEMKFFEDNDIQVELILTDTYTEAQELYISGQTDGIFEVFPDTVFHNAEGIPSQVVYIADFSDTADVVIGSPADKINTLMGKRIGIEGINSFSHIFVLTALEKNGINEGDVTFVDIPAIEVYDALKNDVIDAGHTWDPAKSDALDDGYSILCTAGDLPGLVTDVLVFKQTVIEQRPNDIQKVVNAMVTARDFVYSDKQKAIEIMSQAEGIEQQSILDSLDGLVQPDLEHNFESMKDFDDTNSLFESGRIYIDFYLQRGQINKSLDLNEIIEPRFINSLYQKST